MKTEFGAKFLKELKKVDAPRVKKGVMDFIDEAQSADNLSELAKVKKLKGYKNLYRVRIGEYRIGLVYEGDILTFETILHSKDIYKKFP
jgi:mRNA interferase RelE/StbE